MFFALESASSGWLVSSWPQKDFLIDHIRFCAKLISGLSVEPLESKREQRSTNILMFLWFLKLADCNPLVVFTRCSERPVFLVLKFGSTLLHNNDLHLQGRL